MTNKTVDQLIQDEVYYGVSALIGELAKNEKYQEELLPVLVRDDWENAAKDAGWRKDQLEFITLEGSEKHYTDWQECCQDNGIDPQQNEAYEHWIVSDWLAGKLEDKGEMVLRDFFGLTIWGRTCTGQSISMDYVMQKICQELIAA